MTRSLLIMFLISLLAVSCSRKAKDPCEDLSAAQLLATTFPFRLTDPQTGADLVSGPGATIPIDSVRILRPDGKLGYVVTKVYQSNGSTYLNGPASSDLILEIGRSGYVEQYRVNMKFRPVGCGSEPDSVTFEETAGFLQKDDSGAYLIHLRR